MPLTPVETPALFDSAQFGFSQAIVATGSRTLYLAGQAALDRELNVLHEGDLGAQMSAVLASIAQTVEAAGGAKENLARLTIFVVDYTPDKLDIIAGALKAFAQDGVPPVNSVIGVAALALPGLLVEIEATAVLP